MFALKMKIGRRFINMRIIIVNFIYSSVLLCDVHFTTIHFYDPCRVGQRIPDLLCITVATQASFHYLVRFQLFSGVHVFLLLLFQCSSFKLIVFFHSQVHPKDLFCKQVRKERGRLPLETKMLVIRKMEAGKKRAIVGSSLGLAPTTVSTTMAYAEKIKHST